MKAALLLSALSGWLALSYEIVWYRVVNFTSRGMAGSFGLLLAWYLFGLAIGAVATRKVAPKGGSLYGPIGRFVLLANVAGYAVVPLMSWLVTSYSVVWASTLPLVAVAAAGQGTVFPLLAEAAVAADERAGVNVAWLYVSNILGSVAGTLLTGFLLMDVASLATTSLVLGVAGAAMAGAVTWMGSRKLLQVLPAAATAVAVILLTPALFDGVYERLQRKTGYQNDLRFAHVVETKSGVVTVDPDGTVYGGGIYDGVYNVDPAQEKNDIVRAYAVAALHPRPREVLQIGLASGSWATVIADDPGVERLTVVEINPGYLKLLPLYPAVAGLVTHPKVKIDIDDGRRWLVRHADRKFDVIIGNVWNWRSGSTNLLSREFLELVRRRLNPGGVFYYNTTGSLRVMRTALEVFPHVVRVRNYLLAGDSPVGVDAAALKRRLEGARSLGAPLFDLSKEADRKKFKWVMEMVTGAITSRERLVMECGKEPVMTDDNMGTEWTGGTLE